MLAGLLVAGAALVGAQPVTVAFTDAELGTTTATAASVVAPVGTTCVRAASQTQLTFSWTQPAGGLARGNYYAYVTVAGSSTIVAQSSAIAATATSVTVNTSAGYAANTSFEFHLQAVSGTWQSTVVEGTFATQNVTPVRFATPCAWS